MRAGPMVEPPGWADISPSAWRGEADRARSLLRRAYGVYPDLAPMLAAWVAAWEARAAQYGAAEAEAAAEALAAVRASGPVAEAAFRRARAAEARRLALLGAAWPFVAEAPPVDAVAAK